MSSSRTALVAAVVLGVPIVVLAATGTLGYAADDYWQLCALEGGSYPGGPAAGDLFRFWSGNPEDNLAAMRAGALAWYTDPELKVWFSRPLSTALYRLDYELFGKDPTFAKLHGLLWYVLLVALVARLYRRLLEPRAAALGAFAFAVCGAHWQIVAWLAARNATVTAVFGVAALLTHLRFREGGGWPNLVASVLLLGLGFAAGEATLGVLGYFLAYELLVRSGRRPASVVAGLAPVAVVSACWLALWAAAGYGTYASGAYIDPIHEPLTFLAHLPARLFAMTGMALFGFPADYWFLEPQTQPLAVASGVAAAVLLTLLAVAAWPALRARWRPCAALLLGMLIAMVPQAAGFLGARSLTMPSIGSSALLGAVLVAAWQRVRSEGATRLPRSLVWSALGVLACVNLVVSPLSWFASSVLYSRVTTQTEANARDLRLPAGTREVVAISAPDPFFGRYFPFQRRVLGLPTPEVWRTLTIAPHSYRVVRVAPDALELDVVDGHLLASPFEVLWRRPERRLPVGHQVRLGDFTARVVATDDVGPTRVVFDFDRPLDDASLFLLAWHDGRMVPIEPPPLGGELLLPWQPGPSAL